jgi:hypothetical protein
MSSAQRLYAQRSSTNITQIIPTYVGSLTDNSFLDMSGCVTYVLNMPNVQRVGGVYYVDLSSVDTSGNLLDIGGVLNSAANNINFTINVPFNPAYAPGLEFTIFFKNPPLDRVTYGYIVLPLLTIGFVGQNGTPVPYMYSAPIPWDISSTSCSLTFKSDGSGYSVTGAGPVWYGPALIGILLSAV